MIIDCHCHAGKGDGLTGPLGHGRPAGGLPAARGRRRHHPHGAALPPSTRTTQAANRQVARLVAADPERFYGFACVHAAERPRARVRAGAGGGAAARLPRPQGAPPRGAHHPRGVRGGARLRAARALRRDGRGLAAWSCSPPSTRTWPSSSRTWAASRTTGGRSARCWTRCRAMPNVYADTAGSAPLRPAGGGGGAGRSAQAALRLGRPVAAPGGGAGQGARAGAVPEGRAARCWAATCCG